MADKVFTIGHSTHSTARFVELLRKAGVTAVSDVRSRPFSRMNPQFNKDELRSSLKEHSIEYVFLGKELGARSDDPDMYESGQVKYDRLAQSALFRSGIERVIGGTSRYTIALMCAEKEPLECHRTILVARELERRGIEVQHILSDGTMETHADAIARLVAKLGISPEDMFRPSQEVVEEAYKKQGSLIEYRDESGARSTERPATSGRPIL